MIDDRWRATVARRPTATALCEVATGRSVTFAELDQLAVPAQAGFSGVVTARYDATIEFFAVVIGALKSGLPVMPLEPGTPPCNTGGPPPPPEVAVLKTTAVGDGNIRTVALDAASQIAEGEMLCRSLALDHGKVAIAGVSPAHSYGFGVLVLPLVLSGMSVILPSDSLQPSIRTALGISGRDENVFLPGVPSLWKGWSGSGILTGFSGLATSAGSPLRTDLQDEIRQAGGPGLVNLYGTSETGAVAVTIPSDPRSEPGDIGHPLPGITLAQDVPTGRLRVAGASLGLGYWGADGITPFRDRSVLTYDLAHRRPDNAGWRITGFAGESINTSGRKVSPIRIEEISRRVLGISRIKAFPVSSRDAERHQEVGLAIGIDGPSRGQRFRSQLYPHLESWELPRVFWCCGESGWDDPDQRGESWALRHHSASPS